MLAARKGCTQEHCSRPDLQRSCSVCLLIVRQHGKLLSRLQHSSFIPDLLIPAAYRCVKSAGAAAVCCLVLKPDSAVSLGTPGLQLLPLPWQLLAACPAHQLEPLLWLSAPRCPAHQMP